MVQRVTSANPLLTSCLKIWELDYYRATISHMACTVCGQTVMIIKQTVQQTVMIIFLHVWIYICLLG